MPYPKATPKDIAYFNDHGFIVVEDAIDLLDLKEIANRCDEIVEHKETYAGDWAWEKGKAIEERDFKIVQAFPSQLWPEFMWDAPSRQWAVSFATALMGRDVQFWYDQFLAKPPAIGAQTYWHQDEAYWGRKSSDSGITCWMPFHDVDETNGCMTFIDGGHHLGVLEHRRVDNVQSDLLYCVPDESLAVACPIQVGSVTFHHSKMPHMTAANKTSQWRRILTQHLLAVGSQAGDDYPWRVYVEQPRTREPKTGAVAVPTSSHSPSAS